LVRAVALDGSADGAPTPALAPTSAPVPVRDVERSATAAAPESGTPAPDAGPDDLRGRIESYLTEVLAGTTKMDAGEIDPTVPLERYGIDSLMITRLNAELEERIGEQLSKTLFFEYQTVEELVEYFVEEHAERLQELTARTGPEATGPHPAPAATGAPDAPGASAAGAAASLAAPVRNGRFLAPGDLTGTAEPAANGGDDHRGE
ncbi:acyl carrier protein, partial [Streptomyces noursei]|uniref:acyl carrier protein n=1 Tax=Streptomyces noursei TaxID=1971 RepID=UPI002278D7DD